MTSERFEKITAQYASLHVAVVGDFCLDRYLEIDPSREEVSIETGLPVYNISGVRAQPGGAGTIVNNLSALGVHAIYPIGFAGQDGEGFELCRALEERRGVSLEYFVRTAQRHTFTYCKPLLLHSGRPPEELNRLDLKNWTPTPALLQGLLGVRLREAARNVDAVIIQDQVEVPETGVVTRVLLDRLKEVIVLEPELVVLADSRRSLRGFPPVIFKMNSAELSAFAGAKSDLSEEEIQDVAAALAVRNRRSVFITLAERGIMGTTVHGLSARRAALPIRGAIDVVGAGDAVSANLAAAIAVGAELSETLELANAAASVVIHKLGTTGTANLGEIEALVVEE
jgi:rfaE bifunctional protein kinase chain/domain